jgi:hypothetical protein
MTAEFNIQPPAIEPISDDALAAIKAAIEASSQSQRNDPTELQPGWRRQTIRRLIARLEAAEKSRDNWHDAAEHWKAERKLREEAFAVDGKTEDLLRAVTEWRQARAAVLQDPTPDVRQSDAFRSALNRLASAEDALFNLKGPGQ